MPDPNASDDQVPVLTRFADSELIRLRATLDVEMKRRKQAITVGQMTEELAIQLFNSTAGFEK